MSKEVYDAIYLGQKELSEMPVDDPDFWDGRGFHGSTKILDTYGFSNHGAGYLQEVMAMAKMESGDPETNRPFTVMDIGCGHNQFAKNLRKHGIPAVGVDCSCPSADLKIDLEIQGLPYPNKYFGLVTGFDVLEHLRQDRIQAALSELQRVSERFLFTIGTTESSVNYRAINLHEIQRPLGWWDVLLRDFTDFVRIEQPRTISGRW